MRQRSPRHCHDSSWSWRLESTAGDLAMAKQHLWESLRMKRSLHGDRDHSDIAATLHELGLLSRQAGDLPLAKQHLEESLRMKCSLHWYKDHPNIAATLYALGGLGRQAWDVPLAKQHFGGLNPGKRLRSFSVGVYSFWSLFLLYGIWPKIALKKNPHDSEQRSIVVYIIVGRLNQKHEDSSFLPGIDRCHPVYKWIWKNADPMNLCQFQVCCARWWVQVVSNYGLESLHSNHKCFTKAFLWRNSI